MATKGPKIACNNCGADVTMHALEENNGVIVGCSCTSLDSVPYELTTAELPEDWHRFDDPGSNPWPSEKYREASSAGGDDER